MYTADNYNNSESLEKHGSVFYYVIFFLLLLLLPFSILIYCPYRKQKQLYHLSMRQIDSLSDRCTAVIIFFHLYTDILGLIPQFLHNIARSILFSLILFFFRQFFYSFTHCVVVVATGWGEQKKKLYTFHTVCNYRRFKPIAN